MSIETYRNCFILSLFLNLKINNMIIIEFDIEKKVFNQFQKVKQMYELLRLLFSDFIGEINTKSSRINRIWVKKLILFIGLRMTEAYEINKNNSIQTI
ncbi:hypothetical protein [Staphylococcus haemolyticus]|uniref:hypothetical protein n=1 Tax=Staphylococcus haemolyticus TaxID=1283 RepID=UPI001F544C4F|nr:hypothetical protein [Staphylococcus haemolyticus]